MASEVAATAEVAQGAGVPEEVESAAEVRAVEAVVVVMAVTACVVDVRLVVVGQAMEAVGQAVAEWAAAAVATVAAWS